MVIVFIFVYVAILHLAWGILLFFWPVAANTTPTAEFIVWFGDHQLAGIVSFLTGVAAILSMQIENRRPSYSIVLLVPQQALLIISAVGAITAVSAGMYADLEPRPRAFILTDQLPVIVIAVVHLAAVLHLHSRAFFEEMVSQARVTWSMLRRLLS